MVGYLAGIEINACGAVALDCPGIRHATEPPFDLDAVQCAGDQSSLLVRDRPGRVEADRVVVADIRDRTGIDDLTRATLNRDCGILVMERRVWLAVVFDQAM